ncbi:PQQ-binding-like beta-propeller repeat protein [bacterium]|nr:PQQ-binding-like beta-propeller repeat protein [bacterium]
MLFRRVAICSVFIFLVGLAFCQAGEWTKYQITEDTVWDPSENPIVLTRDLYVHDVNPNDLTDRVKLTIMPGTIVKLGAHVDIFVEGVLIAQEALFTSINDDSTPDGSWEESSGQPEIGDWNSIHIYHHDCRFESSTFRYGKSIEIENCSPYLFGNRIENFSRYGFRIVAHDILVNPTLECNTIVDIGEPYTDDNPENGKFDPGQEEYQDLDMNDQYDAGNAIYCYTPPYSYGLSVPIVNFNDIVMSSDPDVSRGGLPIVFENTLPVMLDVDGQLVNPFPDGNIIRQREGDDAFVSAIGVKGYIKPGIQIDGSGEFEYTDYFFPQVDDSAVASNQFLPLPFLVLDDLTISPGCGLRLPPGCVVKFAEGTNFEILGNIETSDDGPSPNYLTSLHNDVFGLRVPGSSSMPAAGDWGCFKICCDECLIANCFISYGRYVMIDQSSPAFINNHISNNYSYGLYIYAESDPARPEISRNVISDCGHVVDASLGLYEGGGICLETGSDYLGPCEPILQDNSLTHNYGFPLTLLGTCDPQYIGNKLTTNYYRAVGIGGTIRGAGATWDDVTGYNYPYAVIDPVVIAGGYRLTGLSTSISPSDALTGVYDILVDVSADWKRNVLTGSRLYPNTKSDAHFAIVSNSNTAIVVADDMSGVAESGDPFEVVVEDAAVLVPQGTIIKMAADMSIYAKGQLVLDGTSRDRIYVTSFNDDTVGGSILLTGPTPMPRPGDWGHIKYENNNNNKVEECVFKYGTSLLIDSCSPIIQHNIITLFEEAGIHCYAHSKMSSPQIIKNGIMCNRNGVLCETDEGFSDPNGAMPIIQSNDIVNNENFGVVNLQPQPVIDARNNWWGAIDGPSGDGDGNGDAISGITIFEPFQTVPNFAIDPAPPVFGDIFPAPSSVDVSTNTIISASITDADSGVDPNTVSIRVNHTDGNGYVYVLKEGVDQNYNGGLIIRADSANGYRYSYIPGQPFASDRMICVRIEASDLELCPNTDQETFCFRTGDNIGLAFGQVTPDIGSTRTQFTYSVDFFDRDLVAPASALVYIDGSPRTMAVNAGDAWQGTFVYATSLKVGYHTFWFEFEGGSGAGIVRLPETGEVPVHYYGPTVLPDERGPAWPMFGHDPDHTACSPVSATSSPTLNWSFIAGDYIISSPVVDENNIVYFGSYDGNIYALNVDGTRKWVASTGDYVASTPALDENGCLFVGSGDESFYCYEPDGSLKWSYKTGGAVDSSPVIGIDGNVYFGCSDNYLYSMTPVGELRWRFETGSWITSSPAIWFDGTVFFGSDDHMLYAVRHDGNPRWSYDTGAVITSSPVVGPNATVYLGTYDNRILAINSDGTLKWRVYTDHTVHSSPALSDDGVLYVGSYDHKLYAIDAEAGTVNWTFETNSRIYTSPAIDGDGNIIFGSHDGNLYCLGKDGSLLWRFHDPQRTSAGYFIHSSPAIGPDGSVYFGSEEKFYALKDRAAQSRGPNFSNASFNSVGKSATRYEFKIHYYDENMNPPSVAKLVIGDSEYPLSLLEGDEANGFFGATVVLTPGDYNHYFVFADAASERWLYPSAGAIDGPKVSDPVHSNPPATHSMPPRVWMAGYYGTHISERFGGKFHVVAYCTDPDNDIAVVQLCYNGLPMVDLKDDGNSYDGLAGDGVYAYYSDVEAGSICSGNYTFEVIATDYEGNHSNVWPYVTIDDYPDFNPRAVATPSSSIMGSFADGAAYGETSKGGSLDINLQNYILDAIRGVRSREFLVSYPEILLAGFGGSNVDVNRGGQVQFNVIVNDPNGPTNVATVEATRREADTSIEFEGVQLDGLTSDGQRAIYGASCFIAGGERGHHVIEIAVVDKEGHKSTFFPYLSVVE